MTGGPPLSRSSSITTAATKTKKKKNMVIIHHASYASAVSFFSLLPDARPRPEQNVSPVSRFHFAFSFLLFARRILCLTCSASSGPSKTFALLRRSVIRLECKCSLSTFSLLLLLLCLSSSEASLRGRCRQSRSRRVLCFSLMLGHPDVVGSRARLSWCNIKVRTW